MYKITQRYSNKLIFVGILAILQAVSFFYITFTIMPFICSASAILWYIEYVKKIDRHSIKHILLCFILFCLGFGMRAGSAFICIFLMSLPIYLIAVRKRENSVWAIIVIMSVCILANYGMTGMQKAYKNTIPEDTYFNQFHQYRALLSDGAKIDYEKNKEKFEAIGITENDMKMYRSYEYADKTVFSNENLKKIINIRSFSDQYTLNIFEFPISSRTAAIIIIYLFALMLCFIVFKERRKEIALFSLFVLGAMLFLFVRKRAPLRVILPITIFGIIVLMYIGMQELTKNIKLDHKVKRLGIIIIVVAFLGVNAANILVNIHIQNSKIDDADKVIEYVDSNQDITYVTDERLRWYASPRILTLKASDNSSPQPYNIFGDWYVYSNFWYEQLDELGLSEYRDCTFKAVLEERVRFVTDEEDVLERTQIFLQEHYDITSEYVLEETIGDTSYGVYKFNAIY
ncbi:MAG: hypothetical protein IKK18_00175 [Clostridia bacterium]|nr:hypothetical protein [Clostridia bacterium]